MKNYEIFSPLPRKDANSIIKEGRDNKIKQAITAGLILEQILNTSDPNAPIIDQWQEYINNQEIWPDGQKNIKKLISEVIVVLHDKLNVITPNDITTLESDHYNAFLETVASPGRRVVIMGALFNQWPDESLAQIEEVKHSLNPKTKE